MDQEKEQQARWQAALSGFEGVWARVAGPTPVTAALPAPAPEPSLWELSQKAAQAAAYDRSLAGCFRGDGRGLLLRHAAEAEHRAALLRAEVFLTDGVCRRYTASCPRLGEPLTALRDAMLRDRGGADALSAAAENARDPEVKALLARLAEEVRETAAEKKCLIRRCFR